MAIVVYNRVLAPEFLAADPEVPDSIPGDARFSE
jgi:hypothetical protein